jgi:hypothetical protein
VVVVVDLLDVEQILVLEVVVELLLSCSPILSQ